MLWRPRPQRQRRWDGSINRNLPNGGRLRGSRRDAYPPGARDSAAAAPPRCAAAAPPSAGAHTATVGCVSQTTATVLITTTPASRREQPPLRQRGPPSEQYAATSVLVAATRATAAHRPDERSRIPFSAWALLSPSQCHSCWLPRAHMWWSAEMRCQRLRRRRRTTLRARSRRTGDTKVGAASGYTWPQLQLARPATAGPPSSAATCFLSARSRQAVHS